MLPRPECAVKPLLMKSSMDNNRFRQPQHRPQDYQRHGLVQRMVVVYGLYVPLIIAHWSHFGATLLQLATMISQRRGLMEQVTQSVR